MRRLPVLPARALSASLVVRFREDASVRDANPGTILEWPGGRMTVAPSDPGLIRMIRALAGGTTEEELDVAADADGAAGLARFYYCMRQWARLGLLRWSVADEAGLVATLEPFGDDVEFPRRGDPGTRYVLSRFACVRRDGTRLVLESPRRAARVVLHRGGILAALHGLASPVTSSDLCGTTPPALRPSVPLLLDLLAATSVIEPVGDGGMTVEDANAPLRQWEFHDLLLHTRSRIGRFDGPMGAMCSYLGEIPPLPAVKPAMAAQPVALHRPDLNALMREDPPFAAVLEARRSVRTYGTRAITARELGEFLFRTARIRGPLERAPDGGRLYDVSNRPYPGGGACYELEVYPVVNTCEGLEPGLYHYDPAAHALEPLRGLDEITRALLQDCWWVTARSGPQVLLAISARFQRVSWKYRAMAYAVILKHVGVLFQTMYLAATAMGLAPCAVGSGSADLLARAIGADYHVESAVGEFLLGRP